MRRSQCSFTEDTPLRMSHVEVTIAVDRAGASGDAPVSTSYLYIGVGANAEVARPHVPVTGRPASRLD